ncbi:MAG: DUF2934 domain-containing protein [Methylobacterium frigidaeris]
MDMDGEITLAQIRERAYDIWERNHRPEGFEIEFWLLAERELRAERDARRTDPMPDRVVEAASPASA